MLATCSIVGTSFADGLTWSAPALIDHGAPFSNRQAVGAISCTTTSSTFCVATDLSLGNVLTSTDPGDGASAVWTLKHLDSSAGSSSLNSASCPTTSLCVLTDSVGNVLTSTNPTAGSPSGSAATWTTKKVDANSSPAFNGVSCVSTGASSFFCAADDQLGNVFTSTDPQDGASATWTMKQVDSAHPNLSPMSCTDTPSLMCVTVDGSNSGGNAVISTDPQDGASAVWSTKATGLGGFGQVSCASTTLCVYLVSGTFATSTDPTDGASSVWTTEPVTGANSRGVSCITTGASTFMCVAEDNSGTAYVTVDPQDAATAVWTASAADNSSQHNLQRISCASTSLCVTGDVGGNIIATTNPTSGSPAGSTATWGLEAVDGYNALMDVSCPAGSNVCVGVDDSGRAAITADAGDGASSTWSVAGIDMAGKVGHISCPSTTLCVGIDTAGNAVTSVNPTAGTPAGSASSWHVQSVGDTGNSLNGVSCTAGPSLVCLIVDNHGNAITSTNPSADSGAGPGSGATWNISPVDGTLPLQAASCVSTTLCMAVDSSGNAVTSVNPTAGSPAGASATWVVESVGNSGNQLASVSCTSGASPACFTVGAFNGKVFATVDPTDGATARWGGEATGLGFGGPIACPAASLCVAVGGAPVVTSSNPTSGTPPGSGASWTKVIPDGTSIIGISCPSVSLCVAVDDRGFALFGTTTAPQHTLNVSVAGSGAGTVAGSGISCPGTCSMSYNEGQMVTLTANAAGGSTFTGWSGACTGTGSCDVTMSADRSVTATFVAVTAQPSKLSVSLAGSGTGTVTGSGISCPGTCSMSYDEGQVVTLTANAAGGSTFTGWSGACTGAGPCRVTMSSDRSVTATFTAGSKPPTVKCTLALKSNKVVVRGARKTARSRPKKPKPTGRLTLVARCDQAASLTWSGALTELVGKKPKHGKQRTRTYALGPLRGSAGAAVPVSLTVKLPKSAVTDLGRAANETAVFTLVATNVNGSSRLSIPSTRLRPTH